MLCEMTTNDCTGPLKHHILDTDGNCIEIRYTCTYSFNNPCIKKTTEKHSKNTITESGPENNVTG